MELNPAIFREYDIRGVVDRDLDVDGVEAIGRAFGTDLVRREQQVVCVGRDVRPSSPAFREALVRGLTAAGIDVIDLGICPTPLLYFALHHYDVSAGVMITGSHNPGDFNGLKLCVDRAPIWGEEIQALAELVRAEDFASGEGVVRQAEIVDPYVAYLKGNVRIARPIKVVLDAGNGVAGLVAPKLFEALGMEVVPLFCEPDGRFPNHHPDPTVATNLEPLIERIHETGAELGLAFDGDGDRLGVVTGRGKILWGDEVLLIFARDVLASRPGSTIIGEVKCTQRLYDEVERLGGTPLMWQCGHSRIRAKMREVAAPLAGERSGHLFFADRYFGFDDALYAGSRFLEILGRTRGGAEELLRDIHSVSSTPEIRRPCDDARKFEIVSQLTERLRAEHEIVDIDGVRVRFDDGAWGLVRASNTEPALVLRFEAESERRLDEVRALVEDSLSELTRA